jgi:hypothetical protein
MAEPAAEADPFAALLALLPRARSDLVVFGLAGALALVGLTGPALWRALDPELSASVAFHAGERDDPWGTPFRGDVRGLRPNPPAGVPVPWPPVPTARSAGPDGRDGTDDDLHALPADAWALRSWAALRHCVWAAVVLAVAWETGRAGAAWLRGPWRGPLGEAGRAAAFSAPAGVVMAWAGTSLPRDLAEALSGLLPAWVMVGASAWGAAALAVLLARARAAREPTGPEGDPPAGSAQAQGGPGPE